MFLTLTGCHSVVWFQFFSYFGWRVITASVLLGGAELGGDERVQPALSDELRRTIPHIRITSRAIGIV